jgi:ATP-dependent Clp protease ATP-binding subunit ClpC
VDTEHVLLGLIHDGGGLAARVLESLRIGPQAIRERVEELVGRGGQAPPQAIPFAPRVKRLLDLAVAESSGLGHNYVGTEHILLGLLRAGEGVAAQVLRELGADLDGAREQVIRILDEYRRQQERGTG